MRRCPRWSRPTVRIDGTQECQLLGTGEEICAGIDMMFLPLWGRKDHLGVEKPFSHRKSRVSGEHEERESRNTTGQAAIL